MKETHLCRSAKETMEFAAHMAGSFKGGEVFALMGELGSGKTTFVKGIAQGLQSPAIVTSPTFNLAHRYPGGRLLLIHYDLYRLKKLAEVEALDLETELQGSNVIVIEWPQLAKSILPIHRTHWIEFQEADDNQRKLIVTKR